MSPMWTPQKPPPDARTVSGFSQDGEIVWQALLRRHHRRHQAKEYRPKPVDARNYYQTLYQRCFGTPQSVRNLDLSSPCSSQVSTASTSRKPTLPETPTLGMPLHSTQQEVPLSQPGSWDSGNHQVPAHMSSRQFPRFGDFSREADGISTTPQTECRLGLGSRFNQEQQFLTPLQNTDQFLEHTQPRLFDPLNRKAPAVISRLSDLDQTNEQRFPKPERGNMARAPETGHFELGLESQILTDSVLDSDNMDPSQSLFTQPDSSQLIDSPSPGATQEPAPGPSPPLDLSPENETFHLLQLQLQNARTQGVMDGDESLEGGTSDTGPEGITCSVPATCTADPQLILGTVADVEKTKTGTDLQIPDHQSSQDSDSTTQLSMDTEPPLSDPQDLHKTANETRQGRGPHGNPTCVAGQASEAETLPTPHDKGPPATMAVELEVAEDGGHADKTGNQEMQEQPYHLSENNLVMNTHKPVSSVTRRLQELQSRCSLMAGNGTETSSMCPSTSNGIEKTRKRTHGADHQLTRAGQISIEAALTGGKLGTLPKRPKKSSFSTPFKASGSSSFTPATVSMSSTASKARPVQNECVPTKSRLKKVWEMSDSQREQLVEDLRQAEEVAITLTYDDGSSQLRELPESKKKKASSNDTKVTTLAIAYLRTTHDEKAPTLHFVAFPLGYKTLAGLTSEWCKQTLGDLMASKTRKLCFESQELIQELLNIFNFEHSVVSCKWTVVDPRIAGWLLDPDHPPVIFKQLLVPHPDLKQADDPERDAQVCSDLSLLGPVMLRLYQKLSTQHLWELFTTVEMPLVPILAVMENRGICINREEMKQSCSLLKKNLKKLESQAHQAAGHSFVLNSHAQLRQVLFEELQLDLQLPQNTKKIARTSVNQQKSTSEAVLAQLQHLHPLPDIVLQYRQLQKLKSTYVDGMLVFVQGGQLYTHWDHTAAATGRLTSTNPNIQAIPKQPVTLTGVNDNYIAGRDDDASETVDIYARAPFTSREGWTLLAADFQQIELRLLAHLSADRSLLDVFTDPACTDIFMELTSQWLSKPQCSVSQAEREQTKRVVYSVMYGAGKDRLAEYLKTTSEEAKGIMLSFLVKFPGVGSYTRTCVDQARALGYQCTVLQRRRWLPHINHPSPQLRSQAERQAVNFCIQGSAADLCKVAMIQVERALSGINPQSQARLLFQIHDELLIEVPDSEVPAVAGIVQDIMECSEGLCSGKVKLRVPLKVSLSMGKSWGHMKPYTPTTLTHAEDNEPAA